MSMLQMVKDIQDAVLAVTGIKQAPDFPPDSLNGQYPYVITYVDGGEINRNQARTDINGKVAVEMHFARNDLSRAVEQAMGFGESVPKAIITACANDYSLEFSEFTFGPLGWGSTQTIGWKWVFTFRQIGV